MRLIETHILQPVPVSCQNRDDNNSPKTAIFGGVTRARTSSQCYKRAKRVWMRENFDLPMGTRTRNLAGILRDLLQERGVSPEDATLGGEYAASGLGSTKEDSKDVLSFFAPKEMEVITDELCKAAKARGTWDFKAKAKDKDNGKDKDKKKAKKGKKSEPIDQLITALRPEGNIDAWDIALFGRMVAAHPLLNIEGACFVAHGLSTHQCGNDQDYFTAVDDKPNPGDPLTGHLGVSEFNSACYYRYVGVNWDLFRQTMCNHSTSDCKAILGKFIRACLLAMPQARRNSMFAQCAPGYVLGCVRDGQPLSLANAFEQPVRSTNGYLAESVERLKAEWKNLQETYGVTSDVTVSLPDVTLDSFVEAILGSVIKEEAGA